MRVRISFVTVITIDLVGDGIGRGERGRIKNTRTKRHENSRSHHMSDTEERGKGVISSSSTSSFCFPTTDLQMCSSSSMTHHVIPDNNRISCVCVFLHVVDEMQEEERGEN